MEYDIFCKDRKDGCGGVILDIKTNIISNPTEIEIDCEIIARKITQRNINALKMELAASPIFYPSLVRKI